MAAICVSRLNDVQSHCPIFVSDLQLTSIFGVLACVPWQGRESECRKITRGSRKLEKGAIATGRHKRRVLSMEMVRDKGGGRKRARGRGEEEKREKGEEGREKQRKT